METVLLTIHFLSLAVGIGGGVSSAIAGATFADAEPPVAPAIGKLVSKIGDAGFGALVLLWLTGIILVFTEYGGFGALPGSFSVKMIGVLGLTGAVVAMQIVKRTALKAGHPPDPGRMKTLGQIALVSAIFTIVMAIVTFE
jgi:hypothetical protein